LKVRTASKKDEMAPDVYGLAVAAAF